MQELSALEAEYIDDMNILLVLKPNSGNVFDADSLTAIESLTNASWHIPSVTRVDSLSNFQHIYGDGDDLIVSALVEDAADLSEGERNRIRDIALSEPRIVNLLLAADGAAAAVNLLSNVDLSDTANVGPVNAAVEEMLDRIKAEHPNIEIYESGYVPMIIHWSKGSEIDMQRVFSVAMIIIITGLVYFFRSVKAMAAVMCITLLSVLIAVGALGLLQVQLSPPILMAALMIIVIGLADGIHICKGVMRSLAEGHDKTAAIVNAASSNVTPIALTSLTTTIGFLTFNFSGYDGIQTMGNFVAIGVMCAFVLSLSLLLALLCWCDLSAEKKSAGIPMDQKINALASTRSKAVLLIAILVSVLGTASISFNTIDERMTRYLSEDYVFTVHLEAIQKHLTGTTSMIYNFNSGEAEGVSTPEFLAKVAAFSDWAADIPDVRHVSSITDTVKQLNKSMHGEDPNYYRLPKDRDLTAQYLLLYELSLPNGLDLGTSFNFDKSATRVILTVDDMSTTRAEQIVALNSQWLEQHAPEFSRQAHSNSLSPLLANRAAVETSIASGITALLIIGAILLVTFRSLLAGALCAAAVLAPILITYGIWGLVSGTITLAAAITIGMVIGIAVDFSVHFMSKYLHALRVLNYCVPNSVSYALRMVTAPIVTSAVVLCAGFAVLSFSIFELNQILGQLTAICIFLSGVAALLVLPSALLSGPIARQFAEK